MLLDLARTRPVLLDGALGTELMKRGLPQGALPEIWNVENPGGVRSVHAAYFAAGSDAVSTNSFGGHPLKLAASGLRARCAELNRAAAEIAASVRPSGRYIIGSLGPCGKLLRPQGDATEAELEAGFSEQVRALAEGGVDLILLETMIDLREALCALSGSKKAAPGLPVAASMTFNQTRRGFFTLMGDSVVRCAAELGRNDLGAFGANCTLASGAMIALAREIRAATSLPVIIQPNAGQPEIDGTGGMVYAQTPAEFASDMAQAAAAGANILGGCCGTNPDSILALSAVLSRS